MCKKKLAQDHVKILSTKIYMYKKDLALNNLQ